MTSSPDTESLLSRAKDAVLSGTQYAWGIFREDNHWCGELLSNATITAEQVLFHQSLLDDQSNDAYDKSPRNSIIPDADAYRRYLLHDQQVDGSWALAPGQEGNLSASCEAYLALKILGVEVNSIELIRARNWILSKGGVAKVRIFTRIYFAMFGLFPWAAVPELPAEFIFMPSWSPINIYRFSSWARSTIVPLLIICHHRVVYALPNGRSPRNPYLDELWLDANRKCVPYDETSLWQLLRAGEWFTTFFFAIDTILKILGGLRNIPVVRIIARRRCVEWILQHQEPEGDWAGIVPPMHAGVQALFLEGICRDDPVIQKGLAAIERFTWEDEHGKRLQSCVSPVWDTLLMTRALLDSGCVDGNDERLGRAVSWIKSQQIYHAPDIGDWRVYRPSSECGGGWCFEYHNDWYPDVDDTHAAILSLLHYAPHEAATSEAVLAAARWICRMQNRDGGWGAFDADNDRLWLNKIPFSDMDALCDPSTADVTGHVLEAFGTLLKQLVHGKRARDVDTGLILTLNTACQEAIAYLAQQQEPCGAWYGRWGVNYVYGTSGVLCGLQQMLEYMRGAGERNEQVEDMMAAGVTWLRAVQNEDGGWGEGLATYRVGVAETMTSTDSTPSQTAWGLMGLLASGGDVESDRAIVKAVEWLVRRQTKGGQDANKGLSWNETSYTGVGFPNYFYLGYTLYSHYFPLMALGRFVTATVNGGSR